MKNFLLISLLYLVPFSVMSQKVSVQVVKVEKASLSGWQILDENYRLVFPGNEYFRNDSVTFSLEANKRYFLQISVTEIYYRDTSIYTLLLNEEPIILINSDIEPGDHFFPFFTGILNTDSKIVGGTNAAISDFPWQVYFIAGDYQCGGSIINENWILTAAHCTRTGFDNPIPVEDMSVIVGASDLDIVLPEQEYFVSEVIVHEGYDSQTLENDIALLKLKEPVNYLNAKPIKIITSDDVDYGATDPGVMSWVTGWGLTSVTPNVFPAILQKVQLPIVTNEQAASVWSTIPSTDIMAGYLNGNKDACNGDSGGPLAVPVFDKYKLAGIISWGSSKCDTYGGYTRVSDFENWIRAKTGIVKEDWPPAPVGDSLICQGELSGNYSIGDIPGATLYEWNLLPSDAGVVSWNSGNATVSWNTAFTGSADLIARVTIDNVVSEWSKLDLKILLNTKVLSQSNETVICAEQPITLFVSAEGYNLNYYWYKNGNLVQSGPSRQLDILSAETDDSGDYTCEITGICDTILSDVIKLTVYPLTRITYISPDIQIPIGEDGSLDVVSEGHDLVYQWQKDSTVIENSNTSMLMLVNMNANDIGLYRTTVTGTCGTEISDSVYVYVRKADYSNQPEVFLWPSVTMDKFNVALSSDAIYNIYIFNNMGQKIKELSNCRYQTAIDISSAAGGSYIITVFNNDFRKSLRLIKK